jgi:hypothetical protein
MEKKCENCFYYRSFLGTEYCSLDVGKKFWEERKKKYELMCDRYLSKRASFEEQIEYVKKQNATAVKIDNWEEKEEEEEFWGDYSPSEIYRMKQEKKISIANRSEFINKYNSLNPTYPKSKKAPSSKKE